MPFSPLWEYQLSSVSKSFGPPPVSWALWKLESYGFILQMYKAEWGLKVYKRERKKKVPSSITFVLFKVTSGF